MFHIIKYIRRFFEAYPAIHRLFSNYGQKAYKLGRSFGLRIPIVPQAAYFRLIHLMEQYRKPLYRKNGTPRILFYTPRFWNLHSTIESILAHALSMRGAECVFSSCASIQPICNITNVHHGLSMPCKDCGKLIGRMIQKGGYPNHTRSEFISSHDKKEARESIDRLKDNELHSFIYEGLPLGELVLISTRWFLVMHNIEKNPIGMKIYRNFLYVAILVCKESKMLLNSLKPDIVVVLNGLFFEESIMLKWASKLSIPHVTYEAGTLRNSLVFARNKVACWYNPSEHWQDYAERPMTAGQLKWLDDYLQDRQGSSRDIVQYWPTNEKTIESIENRLNMSTQKKIVVLFTNVIWDSSVQGRDTGFKGHYEWIVQNIYYFSKHPEYQLIIRVHPAEICLKGHETIERVAEYIQASFPQLPENVTIIPPESDINSYRLAELAHLIVVYASTIGLESALMGKTVVVAGQVHYRGKGFTIDTHSQEDYFNSIETILNKSSEELTVDVDLARKYAFLLFNRHMIDFSSLIDQYHSSKLRLSFDDLNTLKKGNIDELDSICDFIIQTRGDLKKDTLIF